MGAWSRHGEDAFEPQLFMVCDVTVYGLVSAALFSALMALGGLSGASYSPMVALMPLLMSIAAVGMVPAWRYGLRFSRAMALLLASLWAIVDVAAVVGYAWLTGSLVSWWRKRQRCRASR